MPTASDRKNKGPPGESPGGPAHVESQLDVAMRPRPRKPETSEGDIACEETHGTS